MNTALLINLLGFSVGIALYALLAVMVVRHRGWRRADGVDILLLATAALGTLWNVGELYTFVAKDFGHAEISPFLTAISYSALGFLPSVVVHSAKAKWRGRPWLAYFAYSLSSIAAGLHFGSVFSGEPVPSYSALQTLTIGSVTLSAALLIYHLKQPIEKKAVLASALLVFAVSALHLSGEREGAVWYIELVAHQSSLPLALVILYQNFRFAFADLFLKRALSLIFVSSIALGLYTFLGLPLLRYHETHDRDDMQATAYILGLWIATALMYPTISRFAAMLVDKVILRRVDYALLQRAVATEIDSIEEISAVLDTVCRRIGESLTARVSYWEESSDQPDGQFSLVSHDEKAASVTIPTAEAPHFLIQLEEFFGGRRLLSEEIALLESVALYVARRVDALRVNHERFEQESREHEFVRLATVAQLTALRSQINPHFLFNALTTIGYLIKTSPDRAFDTLLRLTQLLRGVLKATSEFSRLGDEIELLKSYLEVEKARFEEKLEVTISVPRDLESEQVPSLILQPLVENAIKHGISENKMGGKVIISADKARRDGDIYLNLEVWDSGAGVTRHSYFGEPGVGLTNIRERLQAYYGDKAVLNITSDLKKGTRATIAIRHD